ncbi:hypothetical protein BDY24DRAFT_346315 [Mrakia frigida]|uniref:uncharacterized protein n=1 Tax=Mrakia frigida TaxID=29902 RepID=UPI003FCBF85A
MASPAAPVLPSHVKTVLVTGAGGFVGQRLLSSLLSLYPSITVVATDMRPPPIPSRLSVSVKAEERVVSLAADLGDPISIATLFEGRKVDLVFALHGIMSGGSEADFELGYRVNVDSHLALLKYTTKHHKDERQGAPLPIYIYISGLAVYGGPACEPKADVNGDDTPLYPETSYGVAKAITELYVYDYTRKNYVDGRIMRLPTVAIRAGAPSSAASSFISGLIREPLQGKRSECPVANGLDDPNLDEIPVYLSRVKTIIHNILFSSTVPAASFPAHSRCVNIPGVSTTTRGILDALVEVGGPDALKLVDFKKDEKVLAIMAHWPGSFRNEAALALGFHRDDVVTGFADAVRDFKAELEEAK